jgi:hypothetical protein
MLADIGMENLEAEPAHGVSSAIPRISAAALFMEVI